MLKETNITEAKDNLFKVSKYIDDLTMIDSGVIHCVTGNLIKIKLNNFDLNFILTKDVETKRKLRVKDQSGKHLTLEFINFNESLGSGVLEPTSLFVLNGFEIFFTFFIRSLDDNQKEFTYSLLYKTKN
ncbi:DUF6864 domain-containing function [Acinetobacter nosocomialis]|uniref:DUF6864 domain-containing function n=1 Tax=Acinetobacter nosocomialis TaxID=106654 RepID=UPI001B83A442|nr:hypothetical protein [Acinetobacter nosocomialis]MBR7679985.1 hypothetical protein [Acinetobacter nosocomialis]MDE3320728.1 hypothetical protein [Acinetobacter nosocomialis]